MSIYREYISILTPDATCSANYIYDNCTWLRFQIEKMLKQIEMGLDSHICFTKLNNNQDVEDRIWGQVVFLNPPMIKKALEKSWVGTPKPLKIWDWNATVSCGPSRGGASPKDLRHWTTSCGWRSFSSTRPRRWKSRHLFALHPSFSAGLDAPLGFSFPFPSTFWAPSESWGFSSCWFA